MVVKIIFTLIFIVFALNVVFKQQNLLSLFTLTFISLFFILMITNGYFDNPKLIEVLVYSLVFIVASGLIFILYIRKKSHLFVLIHKNEEEILVNM